MTKPTIGFVGMTHLGLVSGVASSQKGFKTICFDIDQTKITDLLSGKLPVSEPKLEELISSNSDRLIFTANPVDLTACNVVYVAPDVGTDNCGQSDLSALNSLLDVVFKAANPVATIVILSQVPPGFTRGKWDGERPLYYQVETLIFGRAIERALFPERYIIGCANPKIPLPRDYQKFLDAHECPTLPMRYESAELAKISINMYLVSSVSTTNTISEMCEKIGADWSEIAPTLRLDRRIGPHAYLTPGLGISGGNLERDLATFCKFAEKYDVDSSVVKAWIHDSHYRKNWPLRVFKRIKSKFENKPVIGILGLSYKEDTHSTKNSPSIQTISQLSDYKLKIYDPLVIWDKRWHHNSIICNSAEEVIKDIDVLMILTPWKEFEFIDYQKNNLNKRLKVIIDPYGIINSNDTKQGYELVTLGKSINF
jgi:UDPglucose 6-dehydrogenase